MDKKTNKIEKEMEGQNLPVIQGDDVSKFILQAIKQNLPVEALEKLFSLYKEVKAEKAKEVFVVALTKFQKQCSIVKKTKDVLNRDGRTVRYQYAPIDSVVEQIRKPLAKNGLSYTWDSEREDQHIKVVCKLTHIGGHSEKSTFDIPIVESQYMSSPQTYATAQSYAKRYTLLNVLGIATADDDTDARDTDEKDVKSEKAKIVFLLRGLDRPTDTKEQIVKSVKDLTQLKLEEKNFSEIISRLQVITSETQGLCK